MRKVPLIGGLSLGLFFIMSCGQSTSSDQGGSGVTSEVTAEEFVNSDKMETADRVYSIMTFSPGAVANPLPSMNMFMGPMGTLSAKQANGGRWSCSGNSSGNLEDKDGDYIPVDGLFDFECSMSFSQGSSTWQGRVNVKDDDDNNKKSGWDSCTGTISNDNCSREPITMVMQMNSESYRLDRIFDFDLDHTGVYTFTTFYYQWKGYMNDILKFTVTVDGSGLSFREQDDGDDEIFDNGTWNGTVSVSFTNHENNENGTCNVSFNNLYVSETCGGAESGTFEISCSCPQGSAVTQSSLSLNFTGCGHGSVTVQDCDGYTQTFTF